MQAFTVAELAEKVGGILEGDGSSRVAGIGTIRDATSSEVAFINSVRHTHYASKTRAAAVVVPLTWDRPCAAALVRVENTDRAFARIAGLFVKRRPSPPPGVHPSSVIAEDSIIAESAIIGPCVVIESGVRIGAGTRVDAGCFLGCGSLVGEECHLHPHVSVRENITIGNRVIVHDGTVIGSDGFSYVAEKDGQRTKLPHIGTVKIGDDVELGANVTIDRARAGFTHISKGVKIDNLVQIAQGVVIGEHSVVVAQAGVASNTSLGSRVILAGQVGVVGNLSIGDGAIIGAQSGVTKDVPPNSFVSGSPAAPHDKTMKIQAGLMRLPELKQRIASLEERLERLEASG